MKNAKKETSKKTFKTLNAADLKQIRGGALSSGAQQERKRKKKATR